MENGTYDHEKKRYYWLRLKQDFFKSKHIKKLRQIAGGDTYTIIYLKMQLKSINTDGVLTYDHIENSFAEELALDLDEDADNVSVVLTFLKSYGLIETCEDDTYFLPEVVECIGSESDSARRVRECREKKREREKQALLCNTSVTECNADVTNCNTEKEIEIEREKEREKEIDTEGEESISTAATPPTLYQTIADMYNQTCVSFPKLMLLSDARKKAIKARLKTYTLEDFDRLFIKAELSDFLKGKNDRNWSANFDWLIKDSNMAKVLDGNYDNRLKTKKGIDWDNV